MGATRDVTAPAVVITGPTGSNPANASDSTTFTLTFTDSNLGSIVNSTVNSGITINGTNTGCSSSTSVSGAVATVTITGCTGNGTASITAASSAWSDLAGNPLTANGPSSTFTVNNTAPSIAISTPANNSWINTSNDSSSFSVNGTCNASGQTVTIKIDGTANGTATCNGTTFASTNVNTTGLSEAAHTFTASVTDLAGNTGISGGISATRDLTAPVVSMSAPGGSTTANSSASTTYTLTFSDTNLGTIVNTTINAGLTINGTNTGCTKSTTVSGAVATVTITGCTGNGTASITANSSAWSDLAGNALTANGPSTTFTVNNTAPNIAITSPANSSWINIASDSSTFSVSGTCTESTQAQVNGQAVTVKIDGTSAGTTTCSSGTFSTTVNTTTLSASAHSFTATITDLANNTAVSGTNSVTRDITAPVVVITGPGGSNPANAASSNTYTLTFSDTNLGTIVNSTINGGLTINGTSAGCTKTTSVSGAVATVTLTGCTGDGTASITAGSSAWTDLAGNPLIANGPSTIFTVDNTLPSIAITSPANNTWINIASDSSTFTVSGTCTETTQSELTGQTVTIKIDGNTATTTPCTAGGTFSGTVDTTALTQAAHNFTANVIDLASNSATSPTNSVTRDVTAPTVVIAGPGGNNPANASDSTTYTLTFSDTNLGTIVNSTINSGITINGTNTGCTSTTSVSGAVATVTITNCSGNGNASITATTATWSDLAGNPLTANGPSSTFTVNNVLPTIAITTPANGSWINIASDSSTFAVSGTCSEATQSELTGQTVTIKIDGITAGTGICTSGGTFTGTVDTTVLTQTAHNFTATVTDLASNAATSSTNSVIRDVTAPTVVIAGPSGDNPANSTGHTTYSLTFSDTNLGTLNGTTINSGITINGTNAGCTSSASIAGAVATITITGCTGTGNVSISAESSAWSDQAGNALTANGPSATFTVTP